MTDLPTDIPGLLYYRAFLSDHQLHTNPCPTDTLTFVEELVSSEKALPGSGVVRLEDDFEGLMDRNEWLWKLDAAQSVLEVLH